MTIKIYNENLKPKLNYPVVMESKNDGDLVLFFSECKGVSINPKCDSYGQFSEDWIPATNEEQWRNLTWR